MSDFRALAEKTVVELFDMVKEKVSEIERKQAEIDLLKRSIEIKDRVRDEQQAKIDELKHQKSLQELAINQISQANQEWRRINSDLQKRVDEVLEYLDGESANRWGLWKEKADMLDQGASNAFEEAYWVAKKALRGAND